MIERLAGSASEPPLLLRPAEAAHLLAVSRSKVYLLVHAGVLPAIRVGDSVRLPRRELELWISAQVGSGPP